MSLQWAVVIRFQGNRMKRKNQETMMMDDVDQVNPPLAFPLS
jgi:hypothetical protein